MAVLDYEKYCGVENTSKESKVDTKQKQNWSDLSFRLAS